MLRAVTLRLQLAEEIGRAKREHGLPVRDYGVEADVEAWWRSGFEALDIPPERSDQFARWLVEEAVRVQERFGEAADPHPQPTDILIVGGGGAMGRWLAGFLTGGGHRIAVLDPRARPTDLPGCKVVSDLAEGLASPSVVIVATPMSAAPGVYRSVVDHGLGRHCLLFDVLSMKAPLLPEIARARARGVRVTSVHPLFGPATRVLSGRNLLVMDCGDPAAAEEASALFRRSALAITRLPLDSHDPLMAEVLALPHAVSLLFSLVLSRSNGSADRLAAVSPLSYARQAEVARIVTEENPQLSFEIQHLNDGSVEMLQRLEKATAELREAIREADPARYNALLTETRTFWSNRAEPPKPERRSQATGGVNSRMR